MGWVTLTLRKSNLKQDHSYYQLRDLQISREKRQLARKKTFETNKILTEQRQMERDLKENYYYEAKRIKEEKLQALHEAYDNYKASHTEGVNAEEYKFLTGQWSNEKPAGSGFFSWLTGEEPLYKGNFEHSEKGYRLADGLNDAGTAKLAGYEEKISENESLLSFSDWEKDNAPGGETTSRITEEYEDAILEYQEKKNELKTDYDQEIAMNEEEVADEELALDQEQVEIEAQMEAISQELQAVTQAVSQQIQASTIKLA